MNNKAIFSLTILLLSAFFLCAMEQDPFSPTIPLDTSDTAGPAATRTRSASQSQRLHQVPVVETEAYAVYTKIRQRRASMSKKNMVELTNAKTTETVEN